MSLCPSSTSMDCAYYQKHINAKEELRKALNCIGDLRNCVTGERYYIPRKAKAKFDSKFDFKVTFHSI